MPPVRRIQAPPEYDGIRIEGPPSVLLPSGVLVIPSSSFPTLHGPEQKRKDDLRADLVPRLYAPWTIQYLVTDLPRWC
jgi:hypothetical protein